MNRPGRTAALLTVAVGSLAACTGADGGASDPTDTTATDPAATSAPTSPAPSPTPDAAPIAAVTAAGEVVLIDVDSGERLDVLMDGIDTSDPAANSISMGPDGEWVYVTRPDRQGGGGTVARVPVDGGEPELIDDGLAAEISPDGETLAYTVAQEGAVEGADVSVAEPTIVLYELDSGERTTLRSQEQDAYFYIGELTWSADGSELVFMAGEIVTGIHVLDADAESLDEARHLGPDDGETSWRASAAVDEGRLAVVAVDGDAIDPEVWTVRVVDLESGEVLDEPLPQDRLEVGSIDARPGRPGLVMVEAAGPEGGTLLHWDGADQVRELTDGIVTAAW